MGSIMNIVVSMIFLATSAAADSSCGPNACEKPTSSSTFTLPIILGVAIPVTGAAILFIILQRRHTRKQREEDANDRHASMDFGLGDVPNAGRSTKGHSGEGIGEEKSEISRRQVSMDMTINSPYLLPPELKNSQESLHSLSRSIHNQEDPYRPISQYFPGDSMSIRSQSKKGSSIYTNSSLAPSRVHDRTDLLPNASNMPRSNPAGAFVRPPRQNSLPQGNRPKNNYGSDSSGSMNPYLEESRQGCLSDSAARTTSSHGLPLNSRHLPSPIIEDGRESKGSNSASAADTQDNAQLRVHNDAGEVPSSFPGHLEREPMLPNFAVPSPYSENDLMISSHPHSEECTTIGSRLIRANEDEPGSEDMAMTLPLGREGSADYMREQRYSMDGPPEEYNQHSLGPPRYNGNRISVGFRPLPPDTITETDDPEIRANRIRSFYKEYFEDSAPGPGPIAACSDDHGENYYGDAAYFDPDSKQFIMPYAQPVTRRAMTPPPIGARSQGPPRGRNSSIGAMNLGGGRGPARFSPAPRAHSSASGHVRPVGAPGPKPVQKRSLAPPRALTTLPTPSKLREDSFTLNPTDFAPPFSYRERAAGRSESPLGERRPYSPMVPAYSPVISAYDELGAIPSPHMLHQSGTLSSLDFAPPKKFRETDSMSDAGSIRSNRSGISQTQLGAIRNGAYRVSRIPGDVVFSKDNLTTTLKPQWDMSR